MTRPSRRMLLLSSVALAALGGCALQSANFRPATDQPAGTEIGTNRYYTISVGGQVVGKAKIWSPGSYLPRGYERPVVDVRMKIQNQSDQPIALDVARSEVEVGYAGHQTATLPTAPAMAAKSTIAPHSVGHIALLYQLPPGVWAGEVNGFDFDWAVRTGAGEYSQVTSFAREQSSGEYVGFYPVLHGPWWWWGYPAYAFFPDYYYGYYDWYQPGGIYLEVEPEHHPVAHDARHRRHR